MSRRSLKFICCMVALFSVSLLSSCSKEEEVRRPEDILGVWSPDDTTYLEFSTGNVVHRLQIEYQDGESIGWWTEDVFYYEPGYNLVIYISSDYTAQVYEVVKLSSRQLTWCWVDEIKATSTSSIGQIIGDIIKKAQEGYKLDPELFQDFTKISEDDFFSLLESLDIQYPWGDDWGDWDDWGEGFD